MSPEKDIKLRISIDGKETEATLALTDEQLARIIRTSEGAEGSLKALTDEFELLSAKLAKVKVGTDEFARLKKEVEAARAKLDTARQAASGVDTLTQKSGSARMAVTSLSQTLSDSVMFQNGFKMGMMSIGNNLDMLVQSLMIAKAEAVSSGTTLKQSLLSVISGPSGMMLGLTGVITLLQVLPGLFASASKSASDAAEEGLKEFSESLSGLSLGQIEGVGSRLKRDLQAAKDRYDKYLADQTEKTTSTDQYGGSTTIYTKKPTYNAAYAAALKNDVDLIQKLYDKNKDVIDAEEARVRVQTASSESMKKEMTTVQRLTSEIAALEKEQKSAKDSEQQYIADQIERKKNELKDLQKSSSERKKEAEDAKKKTDDEKKRLSQEAQKTREDALEAAKEQYDYSGDPTRYQAILALQIESESSEKRKNKLLVDQKKLYEEIGKKNVEANERTAAVESWARKENEARSRLNELGAPTDLGTGYQEQLDLYTIVTDSMIEADRRRMASVEEMISSDIEMVNEEISARQALAQMSVETAMQMYDANRSMAQNYLASIDAIISGLIRQAVASWMASQAALGPWGLITAIAGGAAIGTAVEAVLSAIAPRRAQGGWITGAGTETSDSIPVFASNGEYIVNAEAARSNASLLEAINSGSHVSGYFQQPWQKIDITELRTEFARLGRTIERNPPRVAIYGETDFNKYSRAQSDIALLEETRTL